LAEMVCSNSFPLRTIAERSGPVCIGKYAPPASWGMADAHRLPQAGPGRRPRPCRNRPRLMAHPLIEVVYGEVSAFPDGHWIKPRPAR
jgi:folate-dependent tRNA-U54 methylase TrmFO/GidA